MLHYGGEHQFVWVGFEFLAQKSNYFSIQLTVLGCGAIIVLLKGKNSGVDFSCMMFNSFIMNKAVFAPQQQGSYPRSKVSWLEVNAKYLFKRYFSDTHTIQTLLWLIFTT